jgi:hypothetical protein
MDHDVVQTASEVSGVAYGSDCEGTLPKLPESCDENEGGLDDRSTPFEKDITPACRLFFDEQPPTTPGTPRPSNTARPHTPPSPIVRVLMEDVDEPIDNAELAQAVLPEALEVGTEFDTFQDFKTAVNTWAVAGRFGIRVAKSDRKRNVIRCRDSAECVFNARAAWKVALCRKGSLLAPGFQTAGSERRLTTIIQVVVTCNCCQPRAYTPNELSADRRRSPTIVASPIIPKSGNYQRTKITAFFFLLGCQTGPKQFFVCVHY